MPVLCGEALYQNFKRMNETAEALEYDIRKVNFLEVPFLSFSCSFVCLADVSCSLWYYHGTV